MAVSPQQVEKYQKTAAKYGLELAEADILYLQAFMRQIAREEILKARKAHEQKPNPEPGK